MCVCVDVRALGATKWCTYGYQNNHRYEIQKARDSSSYAWQYSAQL